MSKKIYVGNLSYSTTEETLRNQFSQFGEVETVTIIMDKMTNRSKGFGFVEMTDDDAALDAISTLNQKDIDGRKVRVNEAEERKPRPRFDDNRDGRN
ncbi:MAG: RNA-binding protein [Treponema sp.]|uniref:RNA recognition motif domain-containing protein n=1 Tax=Treponema sp. TaxID=166 RepID=UPI00298E9EAD|nr:RNA-binding protein [Treponema sp.]MCQ2602025.1 RNA-binding protein [Treponema sp.]